MIKHTHTGICTCGEDHGTLLTQSQIKQFDPTRTLVLRNAFAHQMDVRFNKLIRLIKQSVVEQDCFGLKPTPTTFQVGVTGGRAFAFNTSQQKIDEFMKWLQEQVNNGIITITEMRQIGASINSSWTDLFIEDSYKRGVIRARYEMIKQGWNIPTIEMSGGIAMVMANSPFHVERMGLLFARTYNDLKGITDAMSSQISRVLAQGMADGDGPAFLARKLVSVINGTGETLAIKDTLGRFISAQRRATTLARTEIIRAHSDATLQEYKNWGVVGVNVKAEWTTAGDGRVCEICASLEGKVFELSDAEGLIPLHPNCRCLFLPTMPEK